MANLIITIISIALVAVAALMGAYYGGQAFFGGQAKARANQIISNANQIAGAIQVWQSANARGANDYPAWNHSTGASSTLIPDYLASMPLLEHEDTSRRYFGLLKVEGGTLEPMDVEAVAGAGSLSAPSYFLGLYYILNESSSVGSGAVCSAINQIVKNDPSVPDSYGVMDDSPTNILIGLKFRCLYDSLIGHEIFVYRVN